MEMPNWKHVIVAVILGMILLFCAINFVAQPLYSLGCCWMNGNFTCGGGSWDGSCTAEIVDECCSEIRYCGEEEIVDNPNDCYANYCAASQQMCIPEYNIATGGYKCVCADVNTQN